MPTYEFDHEAHTVVITGLTLDLELQELLTFMAGEPATVVDGKIHIHYIKANWNCFSRFDLNTAIRQYLKK